MKTRALLVLLALGCGPAGNPDCEVEPILQDLAGPVAVDCGVHEVTSPGQQFPEVDACMVDAFKAGMPFYVAYFRTDVEPDTSSGWASDGERLWSVNRSSIRFIAGSECLEPEVRPSNVDGHDTLACANAQGCTLDSCGDREEQACK